MRKLMIYGANGYTGRLIAREQQDQVELSRQRLLLRRAGRRPAERPREPVGRVHNRKAHPGFEVQFFCQHRARERFAVTVSLVTS